MDAVKLGWGLVLTAVLVWIVSRLVRSPRDVPLWSITAMLVCWAAGYPFGTAARVPTEFLGISPALCKGISYALSMAGVGFLVYFFLFSALEVRQARRRAAWYALVLVAAAAAEIAAGLSVPAGTDLGDYSVTGVLVMEVAVCGYAAVMLPIAWVWTRRYARKAEPRLARGLRIASLGEAVMIVNNALFLVLLALGRVHGGTRSASPSSDDPAGMLDALALAVLLLGGMLFLVGISYNSVAMRLIALRVWWRHLRDYHRLRPLWTELHRHFPEDTLHRVPAAYWRDAMSLRGVHRRYYRRAIECRDGLVHISPYLAAVGGRGEAPPTTADLAGLLREALRARTAGMSVSTAATPVAVPEGGDLKADVRELVALSRALSAAGPGGG